MLMCLSIKLFKHAVLHVAVGLRLEVSLCKPHVSSMWCWSGPLGIAWPQEEPGSAPQTCSGEWPQKITGLSKSPLSPEAHRCCSLWWKEARWNFCDTLEEWPHIGLGCYLPRYIRSIPHGPCNKRSRVGHEPSRSWEGKDPKVCPSQIQPLHRPCGHRDVRCVWARGHFLHQGAGTEDQGRDWRAALPAVLVAGLCSSHPMWWRFSSDGHLTPTVNVFI